MALDHIKAYYPQLRELLTSPTHTKQEQTALKNHGLLYIYVGLFLSLPLVEVHLQSESENAWTPFIDASWTPCYPALVDARDLFLRLAPDSGDSTITQGIKWDFLWLIKRPHTFRLRDPREFTPSLKQIQFKLYQVCTPAFIAYSIEERVPKEEVLKRTEEGHRAMIDVINGPRKLKRIFPLGSPATFALASQLLRELFIECEAAFIAVDSLRPDEYGIYKSGLLTHQF